MPPSQKKDQIAAEWTTELAQEWPDRLKSPEQALFECAKTGERLDLPTGGPAARGEAPLDSEAMAAWLAARTIRADVLRHLLVASQWPVHSKGVRLKGAWITGGLDLESATLRCPLVLQDCYVDAPVVLDHATAPRVEISHCLLAGLTGDQLTVAKELDLSRSVVNAEVRLSGAEITGQLICRGAHITGTDSHGFALVAQEVRAGAMLLDEGFTADGAVQLVGANITGMLLCRGAHITAAGTSGYALAADGATIGGGVLLDDGFTANGMVRLVSASITGPLSLRGARISQASGKALLAEQVSVGGSVLLDGGFTAAGTVDLFGASITGSLSFNDAQITRPGPDGDALMADQVKVDGSVFIGGVFTAAGAVQLSGAQIGASLRLEGAMLQGPVALVAEGASIGQQLVWAPRTPVTGQVSLEGTRMHRLDDNWRKDGAFWPGNGNLRLAGLVYDGFGGTYQGTCQQRLGWVRDQHRTPGRVTVGKGHRSQHYNPQPYQQLARVYQQAGQDSEALTISIAARSDLRTYGGLGWWMRLVNWLLDVTIRHGYRPLRAVKLLTVVYLISVGMFWFAQHQDGLMVPVNASATLRPTPSAMVCTTSYPCFYPAGYAIDVTIPIIRTGQADNWRPNTAVSWGWVTLAGAWVFTGLGWAFTTLTVAGYTGLVRKD